MNEQFSEKVLKMAKVLDERHAEDILILDVGKVTILADNFIICSGGAANHVQLLADHLEEAMAKEGITKLRIEGYNDGRWIVIDFGDILVHIFHKEEREFYNIERLWKTEGNFMVYAPEAPAK